MSTPSVVILPASGDATQPSDQERTEILNIVASTIQHALYERAHPEQAHPGPFKQMIAHQDRLYKYINWDDPILTLGSYVGVLSLLFGAHYLPLTQMALKGGLTTLGLVSVTEFASRTLGHRSLSAQLRPKEYMFPESTLNATLKDIHDFAQYAVVQAQRIVFGQDLEKTFAAFCGLTALFWLVKAASPFWLTVVALTSVYAAPLVASARGRGIAREAGAGVQELATTATENGRVVAHDASVGARQLASAATETGRGAAHNASVGVESLVNTTTETGRAATSSINAGAQEMANVSTNTNSKEHASSHFSNNIDGGSISNSGGYETAPRGAANRVSDASYSQTTPSVYARQQHTTAGDEAVAHSVLERPRGAAY